MEVFRPACRFYNGKPPCRVVSTAFESPSRKSHRAKRKLELKSIRPLLSQGATQPGEGSSRRAKDPVQERATRPEQREKPPNSLEDPGAEGRNRLSYLKSLSSKSRCISQRPGTRRSVKSAGPSLDFSPKVAHERAPVNKQASRLKKVSSTLRWVWP